MASNAPADKRSGLSARTLVIASIASLSAAVITSYVSTRGTPIAAAVTPVIVALVSELLNRPAAVIAQRLTVETDALPEAAGAGPPPPRRETRGEAARDDEATRPDDRTSATEALAAGDPTRATEPLAADDPTRPTEALGAGRRARTGEQAATLRQTPSERPVTASTPGEGNGSGAGPPRSGGPRGDGRGPDGMRVYAGQPRRGLPWKAIAVTAALAFLIAASLLTLPELLAGQSVGAGDRGTTFFGGKSRDGRAANKRPGDSRERDSDNGQSAPQREQDRPKPSDGGSSDQQPQPKPPPAPERKAPTPPPQDPAQTAPEQTAPPPAEPTQPQSTP